MNYLFESGLADETGGLILQEIQCGVHVSFMVHYLQELQHEGIALQKKLPLRFIARISRFLISKTKAGRLPTPRRTCNFVGVFTS